MTKHLDFSRPLIMGIINCTDDSFYAGSRIQEQGKLMDRVQLMVEEGADIIDLGGYSSRPGSKDITEEEEWERLAPHINSIRKTYPNLVLSIDTFRASVASRALEEGADIINDISAGKIDPDMLPLIAQHNCAYVMMHMKGNPQTMQGLNNYENLLDEILQYFEQQRQALRALGHRATVIIDPGFGFAKNVAQNFEILENLEVFKSLELPLLAGLSRKSMIYKTVGGDANSALNGTTALHMVAMQKGAKILRVHDVAPARECVQLYLALQKRKKD